MLPYDAPGRVVLLWFVFYTVYLFSASSRWTSVVRVSPVHAMSYLQVLSQKAISVSLLLAIVLAVYFKGYTQSYTAWQSWLSDPTATPPFVCSPHDYTTEIVSLEPLVIYISNFTSAPESASLVAAGAPSLASSEVYLNNRKQASASRTSKSAPIPPSAPVAQCVLARARAFMGGLLAPTDDFSTPQLVRYERGGRFDLHHDWYEAPQRLRDGSARVFNRVASFFVFLEDACEGGETWFPHLEPGPAGGEDRWRAHEDGGVAFRPVSGSALFWVNLHANGTGDRRTMHAGLPLEGGMKTAMNLWPRKFY